MPARMKGNTVKIKALNEIKHGQRVLDLLPCRFDTVCRLTGFDKHTAQKVLADLTKHRYIMKLEDLWVKV